MSPISLVQLAGSVRKFNLNRPFILPILDEEKYSVEFERALGEADFLFKKLNDE